MNNTNNFDNIETIFDLDSDELDALILFRKLTPEMRIELKKRISEFTKNPPDKE